MIKRTLINDDNDDNGGNDNGNGGSLLRLITWNIWSSEDYLQERVLHMITIIKKLHPDLICLQEVTVDSLKIIKDALDTQYHSFQIFVDEGASSGLLLMCRQNTTTIIDQPYYYDFSDTGRRVVGCEIEHNESGKRMHILTTHLEPSPENDFKRAEQFEVINKVIKPLRNCFLCGDFNILNSGEEVERKIEASKLRDVYIDIGCPSKIKYTYNHHKNKNITNKVSARPDRILYSNYHSHTVRALRLLGTDVIDRIGIMPSNHYGLAADFQINK
jgi:exonuclease III